MVLSAKILNINTYIPFYSSPRIHLNGDIKRWTQWHKPTIPTLGRQRLEDGNSRAAPTAHNNNHCSMVYKNSNH